MTRKRAFSRKVLRQGQAWGTLETLVLSALEVDVRGAADRPRESLDEEYLVKWTLCDVFWLGPSLRPGVPSPGFGKLHGHLEKLSGKITGP